MGKDYLIGEGNKIGYLPTEFGTNGQVIEQKIVAGADITKGQVLELTDAMTVSPTSAASKNVIGVAMFDAKSGEPVSVECTGLMKLTASATITAPTQVESAADGKIATVGGTVTNVIGIALTDAEAGKDVIVRMSI